jgi:WD40 repeat protein
MNTVITTFSVPKEILLIIFDSLSPKDFPKISRVCKFWNPLSNDPTLWTRWYAQGRLPENFKIDSSIDAISSAHAVNTIKDLYKEFILNSRLFSGDFVTESPNFRHPITDMQNHGNTIMLCSNEQITSEPLEFEHIGIPSGSKNKVEHVYWLKKDNRFHKIASLNESSTALFDQNQLFFTTNSPEEDGRYAIHLYNLDKFSSFDITNLKPFITLHHSFRLENFKISNDKIVIKNKEGILIYERGDGKLLHQILPKEIASSAWILNDSCLFWSHPQGIKRLDFAHLETKPFITTPLSASTLLLATHAHLITLSKEECQFYPFKEDKPPYTVKITSEFISLDIHLNKLALGYKNGYIRILDPSMSGEVAEYHLINDAITSVKFLSQGKIVTGDANGIVRVWNIEGKETKHLYILQRLTGLGSVKKISYTGHEILALFSKGQLRAWNFYRAK